MADNNCCFVGQNHAWILRVLCGTCYRTDGRRPKGFGLIEIINNPRGGIEGKIGERSVWGANSIPDVHSFTMSQTKKSHFRRVFLLFKLFFAVKIFIPDCLK